MSSQPPPGAAVHRPAAALGEMRAVLFDLDGVLTPTVDVHIAAWSRLFTSYLAERGAEPYAPSDYFTYIDGRPRVDGVRTLLASRDLTLPEGTPDDSPDDDTVWGLGLRKNAVFSAVLEDEGMAAYPGSLVFTRAVIAAGLDVAVVSSSRNAVRVLEVAGIRDLFPVVVDGMVSSERGLAGKPAPDTYLFAAAELGFAAAECVVIEDAHSGVQAGRAGDFGLVVGVDRGVGAEGLYASGADVVVTDLAELLPVLEPAVSRAGGAS